MACWTIYAGGKTKEPFTTLCNAYLKRLNTSKVVLKELEGKQWHKVLKAKSERWIIWAEYGKVLSSPEFWKELDGLEAYSLCFFIGEASGIPEHIVEQGDAVWSFGAMTWPHLWARAMLLEQLYRKKLAQNGHPYSFI